MGGTFTDYNYFYALIDSHKCATHACVENNAKSPLTLFSFFNKNIIFAPEAEYSYFSADFGLKIFF